MSRVGMHYKKTATPYIPSFVKKTACDCPMCDKTHTVIMEWTGRGTPKIHCRQCKDRIANGYDMELHGLMSKKNLPIKDPNPQKARSGKNICIGKRKIP